MTAPNTPEKFWALVDQSGDPDACWPWRGRRRAPRPGSRGAYGRFDWAGGYRPTHRLAYELTHGPIPAGLCVCHRCDNPPCCNPAHLFLGTRADNNRDMVAKGRAVLPSPRGPGGAGGRWARPPVLLGEQNPQARLTSDAVREIRAANDGGESGRSIARRLGVSASAVRDVLTGRRWRHVA